VVAHHIANRRFPESERGEIAMPGLIPDQPVTMFFCTSDIVAPLAFLSMAGVIVFLTAAYIFLLKGRLKWAAF
jgi:hypothetical protein